MQNVVTRWTFNAGEKAIESDFENGDAALGPSYQQKRDRPLNWSLFKDLPRTSAAIKMDSTIDIVFRHQGVH